MVCPFKQYTKLQRILDSFQQLENISKDLLEDPDDFTLFQAIQHSIDLVAGGTMANGPMYNLSPTKSVKLEKQV